MNLYSKAMYQEYIRISMRVDRNMTYTIQEVANLLGITTNKIRFYEEKGLLHTAREINGYRIFTEEDILALQNILLYREIGMSIKDVKGLIRDESKPNDLQHFHKQWEIINRELHHLENMRKTLETLMDYVYEYNDTEFKHKALRVIEKSKEERILRDSWKDQWDFDNWAKSYDSSIRKKLGSIDIYKNYDLLLDNVVKEAVKEDDNSLQILDIGVGTGNLSRKLYERGYMPMGVDQSRAMLEVTKTKNPQLKVRWGDFIRLPFENHQFHIIVSTYALHHLNDREKELAMDEMIRVLHPEGRIVIGDLMFESEQVKKRLYKNLNEEQIREIEDEYYTDIEVLKRYIKKYDKRLEAKQVDEFCWYIMIQ